MNKPTSDDLDDLRQRAERIAQSLAAKGQDAPTVAIEFAGSPKAGKSTNIDTVTHFFKRLGLKVWAPTEGASKRTPYHLKRDLVAYNAWALNYAISELLIGYHNVDKQHLVILDRGPFDSLAWMSLLRDKGELSDDEYQRIEGFSLHPKWIELIDRLYLFTCEPAESLNREHATKLVELEGSAVNDDFLTKLLNQYKALEQKLALSYGDKIMALDTTSGSSPKQSAFNVAKDVVGVFEKRLGL
jgi:thymidylate kinase